MNGCALVTGGSRGIGAAIARALAADGWAVGVNYRVDADAAASVVEEIRASGGRAVAVGADVRDADAPDRLVSTVEEELEMPLLALVNNVGITRDKLVPLLDDESWDTALDTNLSAAFRLTRRALRSMMRKRFGRVVNIASVGAQRANPGQTAYMASKAGLVAFTRCLAVEVARMGITVNAVAPGLIDAGGGKAVVSDVVGRVPMGRPGKPEEVAECVRFFASEGAGYVTGSTITVDGGLSA